MYNINNHVALIGSLEGDPVLRKEQDGSAIGTFTVKCRDNFITRSGDESFQFIEVSKVLPADADPSEAMAGLRKGVMVGVSAQLHARSWIDPDGYNRQELKIIADDVTIMDPAS